MKKWITSNYHYMVPEFDASCQLQADWSFFLGDVQRAVGVLQDRAVPVVLGPVTMAVLTRMDDPKSTTQSLLEQMVPMYKDLLKKLVELGIKEVQIHEPALVLEENLTSLLDVAYPAILPRQSLRINMVSFMDDVGPIHYQWLTAASNGIDVVSLDLTRGDTLQLVQQFGFPAGKTLGAGIVDSRNVWKVDPQVVAQTLAALSSVESIQIQPSGSLHYLPYTLECEVKLLQDHPAAGVLCFAKEKLQEIKVVRDFFAGNSSVLKKHEEAWAQFHQARQEKNSSGSTKARIQALQAGDFERVEPFQERRKKQLQGLPSLPTTTIGSFPQTAEIRKLRAQWKKGTISTADYEKAIDQQIAFCIGIQEGIGLDILVHGEPERTDMVEFFGQYLDGIAFTQNGWVQSFGSRCVRPPIFWNDITRPKAMTVREFQVAQALTKKPVKGMLTGPITILNWSFPRLDITRKEQAFQLALAIRDEVADLEKAGCSVIQVDEPALREGMPLKKEKKQEYLTWAVDAFRLATAVAKSDTQIHTHMCYCEFNDCMDAIDRLDTDVNSIENARSNNATLHAFKRIGYNKGLGPGLYDIHSPVVPPLEWMVQKLDTILTCVDVDQMVVNPDCGLKTRTWPETIAALQVMVSATEQTRHRLGLVQS